MSEFIQELPCRPENSAREDIDEAFCEIDELCQRWDNSLSVKNLTLAERYLKAELEFGCVLEWKADNEVIQKYVAIFERKFPVGGVNSHHGAARHVPRGLVRDVVLYSDHLVRCGYRDDQLMFIGDVEMVETPQGIISSTIRLQSLEDFDRICSRSIDALDGAGLKMPLARTYWESSIVTGCSAAVSDELDGQQVECGSQIMNAVPQNATPIIRNSDVLPVAMELMSRFRFSVGKDAVWMEVIKSRDSRLKITKVFFGPVNLYTHPTKISSHDGKIQSRK